jgi:hypothetical protein
MSAVRRPLVLAVSTACALATISWVTGSAAAADNVTTPSVCQTIDITTTNWSKSLALAQFDPALGTLQSVRITATLKLQGEVQVESHDAAPATITAEVAGHGSLTIPNVGAPLGADPVVSKTYLASAYDGAQDFAGTSGFDTGVVNTFQDFAPSDITGASVAPFVGVGTWSASVTATGLSKASGNGNLVTQTSNLAGAQVCVAYTFLPPVPTTTVAPTTSVGVLPPTLPPPTTVSGSVLPPTGRADGNLAGWAAAFVAAGAVALVAVRRRRVGSPSA